MTNLVIDFLHLQPALLLEKKANRTEIDWAEQTEATEQCTHMSEIKSHKMRRNLQNALNNSLASIQYSG